MNGTTRKLLLGLYYLILIPCVCFFLLPAVEMKIQKNFSSTYRALDLYLGNALCFLIFGILLGISCMIRLQKNELLILLINIVILLIWMFFFYSNNYYAASMKHTGTAIGFHVVLLIEALFRKKN